MAENWNFHCPTEVCFRENGLGEIGELLKERGYRRAFLIYGRSSFKRQGFYDTVAASLTANGLAFAEAGGVGANPDISFVRTALAAARDFKPDVVLACGGGSVIDAAKSVANGYFYSGDPLDFNRHLAVPKKALPVAAVLTLAASGSEMSSSCVISNRADGFKAGFNSPTNYPVLALLDPTLTYTVSPYQTACGLVDIISHSFERFFCPSQAYELSDYLALSVVRTAVELSSKVLASPTDWEARRSMMLTGLFSHNGWTSFGKQSRMPCHRVEHILSGRHQEIAHGEGLRFLLAEFLKANAEELAAKIEKFGRFVFDETDSTKVPDRLEEYFRTLPLHTRMTECGISPEEEKELLALLKL